MVSTEKLYKSDNFPVLHGALVRGEWLYQIRLYHERSPFLSAQAGALRLRMLLGLIENRAVVIDATIRTDGTLQYLSILCSSTASPSVFSRVMRHAVPRAMIEELSREGAEERLAAAAVRDTLRTAIPFAVPVRQAHESRHALLSLLLEYRALVAEYSPVLSGNNPPLRVSGSSDTKANFLFFEQGGEVCAIPDFQVESLSPGANGLMILELCQSGGPRVLVCQDILCVKELDIASCVFSGRRMRGYYTVRAEGAGETQFSLVVPSFL